MDTCFIIDVIRGDQAALAKLDELEAGSDPLMVPTPALFELMEGAERSTSPPRGLETIEKILLDYPVVDVDAQAARHAGRTSAALIRRGQDTDDVDLLIAGIALDRAAPVITRNAKDFNRMEGVRIVAY